MNFSDDAQISGQIGAIFKSDCICIGQGGAEKSARMDHFKP